MSSFPAYTTVLFGQKSPSRVLRPNQMHPAFLHGSHQNLLKLPYTDSSRDMTNRRPRVRYHRMCFRASRPGPFATKWYCVKLACLVHDKLMQFQRCLQAREISLMLPLVSLQNCAEFPDLNHLGLERASLDKLQIITLYSSHCALLLCPFISRIWAFVNKQGRLLFWPQHNKTLFSSDMINKRRSCRLNIFIRSIFYFYRQKSSLGSFRKAELDGVGRQAHTS